MAGELPGWLAEALRAEEAGRAGRGLAAASGRISSGYRQSAPSAGIIGGEDEARAYALTRMPATYAAVAAVLAEVVARAPAFRPASVLDAGAGPGTATWAAHEAWPGLERSLLLDRNAHLLALARRLEAARAASATAEVRSGDIAAAREIGSFDLVVAAYALTEFADAALSVAVASLWASTDGLLVLVEPGRPRDYGRLMRARAQLFALGARIVAPCPHADACPLAAPDWCHFAVRLPRSRAHMRMKSGTLGYEDEKFSYLAVARPGTAAQPAASRVIKPPRQNKARVALELCTPAGIVAQIVPSRDRAAFHMARKLRWGDATEAGQRPPGALGEAAS